MIRLVLAVFPPGAAGPSPSASKFDSSVAGWATASTTYCRNCADLNQVMTGVVSFDDLIKAGKAKFDGKRKGFDQLRSILVPFTPDFEILPGTAAKESTNAPKPFEVRELVNPMVSD